MLTYHMEQRGDLPLYEYLYRRIRADILSGALSPGEKLPSRRRLAEHLRLSVITVEGAYRQLEAEGYIASRPRRGFFVSAVERLEHHAPPPVVEQERRRWRLDLCQGRLDHFPQAAWSRLTRQCLSEGTFLAPCPHQGDWELRRAIAADLGDYRGMEVSPEQVVVGAGAEYLYLLLAQLLGREGPIAVEDPGYPKIRQVYTAGGVACILAPMDTEGVRPEELAGAQVLHCSPSHHFPTGIVTPAKRRQQLLEWANAAPDRYIIEDDYDSEFRFHAHPLPALQTMDRAGRVIYINTFSKTLAPSIRISYMILPDRLMDRFRRELGFYSCTVPSFEQYTLARFLSEGHFEKHLNRMRKFYRSRRNRVIEALGLSPFADRITILEQDAGLHFLLRVDTPLSDRELVALCAGAGIRVRCLGDYYEGNVPVWAERCLVINYSGLREEELLPALNRLAKPLEIGE